jgi:hypothetical protein
MKDSAISMNHFVLQFATRIAEKRRGLTDRELPES